MTSLAILDDPPGVTCTNVFDYSFALLNNNVMLWLIMIINKIFTKARMSKLTNVSA